jgi:hypothetical protein
VSILINEVDLSRGIVVARDRPCEGTAPGHTAALPGFGLSGALHTSLAVSHGRRGRLALRAGEQLVRREACALASDIDSVDVKIAKL